MKKQIIRTLLYVVGIGLLILFMLYVCEKTAQKQQTKKVAKLVVKTEKLNKSQLIDSMRNDADLRIAHACDSTANYYQDKINKRKPKLTNAKKEYNATPDTAAQHASTANTYIKILEADNADKDSANTALVESGLKKDTAIQRLSLNLSESQSNSRQWQTLATKPPSYYQRNKGVIWGVTMTVVTALSSYYIHDRLK